LLSSRHKISSEHYFFSSTTTALCLSPLLFDMPEILAQTIDQHQNDGGPLGKVVQGLEAAWEDSTTLKVADLTQIDEIHSRGRRVTANLLALADIQPSDRILDVGCGLDETARHWATVKGCPVSGGDLTHRYDTVGDQLFRMVGLDGGVENCRGSALDLSSYEKESFDVAYTEHVQMNIAEKSSFYGEIASKLSPGGKFLFHEVIRGNNPEPPAYPCPWAESEDVAKLVPEEDIRDAMEQAGFEIVEWQDQSEKTVEIFSMALQKSSDSGPQPLMVGSTAEDKLKNHVANLKDGRTAVVMGVAVKAVM